MSSTSQIEQLPLPLGDGFEIFPNPNPCVAVYGSGPEGRTCGTCQYLEVWEYARRYYKCTLRLNTHGAATDHRLGWDACGKYSPLEE